jgi:dihydroorotate dehydrogenase
MGLRFPNGVGLAAGFDKNAEAVDGLGRLGFGFIEVGTVTPRPQPGQPRPRLFRLLKSRALINRLGFPSDGAAAIAERLQQRRYRGIVGVNIGKNAETAIEHAIDDYIFCLRRLSGCADYVAVNISSPNTAALRDLHCSERLEPFLSDVVSERNRLCRSTERHLPIVLKISPDLEIESLKDIAAIARRIALDGIIATNTTVQRDSAIQDPVSSEAGGLSGTPLQPLSLKAIATLRQLLGPSFPLIGVGGIDSPATVLAMRAAGADLIQIFTGLIYQGPALIPACVRVLCGAAPLEATPNEQVSKWC